MGSLIEREDDALSDAAGAEPATAAAQPKSCGCKHGCHSQPAAEEEHAAVAVAEVEEQAPPHGGGCGCKHHGHHQASAAMAEGQAPDAATDEPAPGKGKCNCRRMLWVRKVHSACRLVFGGFLVEHLAATSLGLRPALFGRYMEFIHAMLAEAPWLHALIYTPLAVAGGFGGYLLAKAGVRYNVKKCNRGGKLRYWLQRVTAVALLAFLGFHLLTLRNYGHTAGAATGNAAQPAAVFAASVQGLQADWADNPLRLLAIGGVLLGTWAAVYHVSNGLWTASIAWGLLETPEAQRRGQWMCLGIGVVLAILGTAGWVAFCGG